MGVPLSLMQKFQSYLCHKISHFADVGILFPSLSKATRLYISFSVCLSPEAPLVLADLFI